MGGPAEGAEEGGCGQPAEAVLTPEALAARQPEEKEPSSSQERVKARVLLKKLEIEGDGLDRLQVKKTVRRQMSRFRWCYESIL